MYEDRASIPQLDLRTLVGRNMRRIRLAKGLTQGQVAERSGFSQAYLSRVEGGIRSPRINSLGELAEALGVSHIDLVTPDERSEPDGADS